MFDPVLIFVVVKCASVCGPMWYFPPPYFAHNHFLKTFVPCCYFNPEVFLYIDYCIAQLFMVCDWCFVDFVHIVHSHIDRWNYMIKYISYGCTKFGTEAATGTQVYRILVALYGSYELPWLLWASLASVYLRTPVDMMPLLAVWSCVEHLPYLNTFHPSICTV